MKTKRRTPDPFFYSGGKTGILLIHGFTGTASEMRPLGEYLYKQGYTVHAPLLAGHGRTPEEMLTTNWKDWWASAHEGYLKLRKQSERVVVVGLSMGGSLALKLSVTEPLAGVVSLCAPIWVRNRRAYLTGLFQYIMPYRKRDTIKPEHIEEYLVPYDRTPLRCVTSLRRLIRGVRSQLPQVQIPTLVVQAEKDETVTPESASYIYEAISSQDKTLQWYPNSSHIITLDKEREKLFYEIDYFTKRVTSDHYPCDERVERSF